MPTLSPTTKQVLSGLAVGVLSASLAAVEQALANPPFTVRTLLLAACAGAVAGLVHFLPALGTKDKIEAKVAARVTEAVNREAP